MSTSIMSEGGTSNLFSLAENAAPAEDRLMPAERTYPKSSATVSVVEAIALLKKRKANPELRIKGGLDDTSEAVRKTHKKQAEQNTLPADASSDPEYGQHELAVVDEKKPPRRTKNKALEEATDALLHMKHQIDSIHKTVDRIEGATSKAGKKDAVKTDVLQEFKSNSHSVTFMLNGMEFTVKCLNMVKDASSHTLVFVFSDANDSFFTPPMQSELQVKYDGLEEPGKLYYFGMCFSLKQLGLKFLGFIYDDSTNR